MTALLLPYELIDVILKMASKHTDIYYLQLDHNTGKLIYKHNKKCPKLSNLKITPIIQIFEQHLMYNDKMYEIWSYLINGCYYKKNEDNTIFIYYKRDNKKGILTGILTENGVCRSIIDYNIWSTIQHTDGWCYDSVGYPVFSDDPVCLI